MNDLDVRSVEIALQDICDAKRELAAAAQMALAISQLPLNKVIGHLAKALVLIAATEGRSLDRRLATLVNGGVTPSNSPIAWGLKQRTEALRKIICACDALSSEPVQ